MEEYVPTQEERARVEASFRRLSEARDHWDAHVDEFHPKHEGNWIAIQGPCSLAPAPTAPDSHLRAKLDDMGNQPRGYPADRLLDSDPGVVRR